MRAATKPNGTIDLFVSKLADALPQNVRVVVHHLSSHPTQCEAIFAAAPGCKPEKTFCESHFVTMSAAPSPTTSEIFLYAIEVLIYTTEHLTTLFVSKADSTGYNRLTHTPKGAPSLIKTISSVLISHLVATRQRAGVQLVVSLFARAQDQYLFPGSIENGDKHVLDDRRLIRWWCGVLDLVVRQWPAKEEELNVSKAKTNLGDTTTVKGYLIAPGCDKYETLSFLPASLNTDPPESKKWTVSHPLREIAINPAYPPRCLIPHFPDDPKARFLDELDDELPEAQPNHSSPAKRHSNGQWKSVKTLEQFWELMAFRQECSSGRLVGFIWVVFTPPDTLLRRLGENPVAIPLRDLREHRMPATSSQLQQQDILPSSSQISELSAETNFLPLAPSTPSAVPPQMSPKPTSKKRRRPLTGPIIPRQPRTKSRSSQSQSEGPEEKTRYYLWPTSSRGQVILSEKDYRRATELLLRLDFADEKVAESSTKRWIDEVAVIAGVRTWGQLVTGKKEWQPQENTSDKINTLNGTMVKKKRKPNTEGRELESGNEALAVNSTEQTNEKFGNPVADRAQDPTSSGVNILSTGLVRKKPKVGN